MYNSEPQIWVAFCVMCVQVLPTACFMSKYILFVISLTNPKWIQLRHKLRTLTFGLRPVCVGFVVDKAAQIQFLLPLLRFCLVSNIPPMLHNNVLVYHRLCITSAIDSVANF